MNVCILGASGFIGRHLAAALRARGDTVATASLRDPEAAAQTAAACDAIVNLAGENVAQRWSAAAKRAIQSTRVELPKRFLEALARRERSATVYVTASGVGYYGTSETATFDESSPPGTDFLARVCVEWEGVAQTATGLGMRVAAIRTGLALGNDGGALAKMLAPFRMGMGGVAGNGRQWHSWVHIDDVAGIYAAAIDRGSGAYNATAPAPVTNARFTHALAEALHRPAVLPAPTFAIRAMLGEGATIVLDGQRVLPTRTLGELGYAFAFTDIDAALRSLLTA